MKRIFGVVLVASLSLSSSVLAFAQATAGAGAVAGVVSDPTKAAIPGAHVILSNQGIGFRKEVVTGANGDFSFTPLRVVGGYSLQVIAPGFSQGKIDNFATSVGTVITENVTLTIGAQTTTVEVQGGNIEQVQTDTSSVSQLIDSTIWKESPLAVRDSNSFVGLVAGAAGDSAGTGRGFAVNGARTGTGNFMLEGFDNNDQGQGGAGNSGGAITSISPDAIQEYRVITSVPNAEYGRAGGFTTDTVLRSGTKQWHGSAFEYNRIQALAQNNWFSKRGGLQDHLVRNQFGGSLGGPIYKDRTFFFATAEFQRQRQGSPITYTGITQDFFNFVTSGGYRAFMEGTANNTTATRVDPATGVAKPGLGVCQYYTGANCPGALPNLGKLGPVFTKLYAQSPGTFPFGTFNRTPFPTDVFLGGGIDDAHPGVYLPVDIYGDGNLIQTTQFNENRGTFKLDHKLTEHDQLSFTYSADLNNNNLNLGGGDGTPGPPYANVGGAQIFGARYTHNFGANILNDFRAGYLRHVSNFAAFGVDGVPSIVSADSISTGFGATAGFPQLFTENQFSYEDAVTFTHRQHTMKAGFRFVRTRNGSSFYNDVNGTIVPWGAAGILTDGLNEQDIENYFDANNLAGGGYLSGVGTLAEATASQDPTTLTAPDPYRGYRANEFAAYVQDDWKASPRLTVNYGIRWDYFGPPHNFRAGIDSNVYFGTDTSLRAGLNSFAPNIPLLIAEQGATFQYAQSNGRSTIWDRDLNNFAPRLGFAYDTTGTGKFVVRGGFGVGYDRLFNNVYENIRFNGPRFVDNSIGAILGQTAISPTLRSGLYQSPFVGNNLLTGASPVPRHVNQHLKTAYYEQIHLGVETHFGGYVVEANYIGTLGRQLVGLMNANTFEGRTACNTAASAARCTALGITSQSSARPNPRFGNDNFRTNGFSSNYNGGQLSLRKGYSHGFQLLANYTYSKALDQISDVFTIKGGGTGIPTPYNPANNYGPADFDVRHNAQFTVNYVSQASRHKLLLAGWGISPILTMHSGTPIYMKNGNTAYDPNKDGTTGVERAVYKGTGSIRNSLNHGVSPANGFITAGTWGSYVCPGNVNGGLFCEVPGDRNSLYGLRQYNLDAAVSKHIGLGERFSLTLQAAFFDVDGHPEFANPSGDVNSNNFGKSTSSGNREGQLSGRIDF